MPAKNTSPWPKRLLAGGLVLAGLGAMTGFGATAYFTDQDTVGFNRFTTGTVDIDATPDGTSSANAAITMLNMVPGDAIIDDITVSAINNSIPFRYAVSTSATSPDTKNLHTALTLDIREKVTGVNCDAVGGFVGASVYSGTLGNGNKIGDPAAGAQSGDRELDTDTGTATVASETFCVRVGLPTTATNTLQGAETTITFTFDAEQVANNP